MINGVPVMPIDKALAKYKNPFIVISLHWGHEDAMRMLLDNDIPSEMLLDVQDIFEEPNRRQYFGLNHLPHDEAEVFVDCGVYDGDTSKKFTEWCDNKYKHIYCFEPDENSGLRSKKNLAGEIATGKCTIFDVGTWSSETTLAFTGDGTGSSCVTKNSDYKIKVTSLDDKLYHEMHERVTFIKMDIEGSELESLRGAKTIISEQKPKLAICVYHKPEDIIEIPDYIRSLNPDYKFFLRHHNFGWSETVLYAIPN